MKIPVENTTAMPIYVGAHMVPPGEIRLFEAWEVPEHLRPAPAAAVEETKPPGDAIVDLSKESAKEIIAQLDALTDDELNQLAGIEQTKGKEGRKTVLAAISELLLKRAEGGGA